MIAFGPVGLVGFIVVSLAIWVASAIAFGLRRRDPVTIRTGRSSDLAIVPVPTDRPLSSLRGTAHFGGGAVAREIAVLDLHASALVVRSPDDSFHPIVVPESVIDRLRIGRSPVWTTLRIAHRDGRELDVVFRAGAASSLRRVVTAAGWWGKVDGLDGCDGGE